MDSLSFGIITPSYAPDFERCQLLCESIQRFITPPINHYILVDQCDLSLFQRLKSPHTIIIPKEDLLPWWIQRLPWINGWLSLKTLPVRGWLLQQIIKIATAQQIGEDVSVFVDSDVAFIRPFDFQQLGRYGQVRLYHEPKGNFADMVDHVKWHQSASSLLGLSPTPMPAPDYVDHVITWKREIVVQMCQRIEQISGRAWMETLGNSWHLSEYILYGTFVDRVLGEQSGHYGDAQRICHDYWDPKPLAKEALEQFAQGIQPHHVAMMISAKAGMPVAHYRSILDQLNMTWV